MDLAVACLIFFPVLEMFVGVIGWLLMRPGMKTWRETLREPRWLWMKMIFCGSPAAFVLLYPWLMRTVWASLPVMPAPGPGPRLLMGTFSVMILTALAACWICLPPDERSRFPPWRAFWVAFVVLVFNLIVSLPFATL